MTKAELIDAIAGDTGLTKTDAQAALDSFTGVVQRQLKQGDEVAIPGFGKFSVATRAARTGRNPQTGEDIKIKASNAPKFSPGATLKAAVNGNRT